VLARSLGVRLHTHGSETVEEEQFCHERFGSGPTDYLESVGWLGEDVWMAHCVHMSDSDLAKFAATGTGVAHCPSSNARLGTGIARLPEMVAADVPVGLGVDGTASNESGSLGTELRAALLFARARLGPTALTARQVLRLATMGGARVLGREADIGSIEVGKLADLAVWDLDTAEHASIEDEVAALVMGGLPPLSLLLVNGRAVVEDQRVTTVDEDRVARETRTQARRLATIASGDTG
jgi:cytosine/adenosine deaminase-related metal-dependent hydrolase